MRQLDPDSFKIRASMCGKIMTEPKEISNLRKYDNAVAKLSKETHSPTRQKGVDQSEKIELLTAVVSELEKVKDTPILSAGHKTYLKNWAIQKLYDRKQEIISKYLTKGNLNEDEGIDMIADHLGLGMLLKNEKNYSNDWATGTPDVETSTIIIDDKNAWDCFTFPLFEDQCPKSDYYWQAQVYLWLRNKRDYKLVYTLTDTPEHLIDSAARSYCFQNGYDEVTEEIYEAFKARMTYPDIPAELKVKAFDIKRNDEDVDRIKQKVIDSRKWLHTLEYPGKEVPLMLDGEKIGHVVNSSDSNFKDFTAAK